MQVLWERGWIDTRVNKPYHYYSMKGKKDIFGNLQTETSLRHLMENCADFQEEETMLQTMARQMGLEVDHSPKCHCELAGEGIEYAWGCAKNYYRRLLLEKKKGRDNFIASVRESISRNNVTRLRVQKFVKRARRYMAGYHILRQMKEGAINNTHEGQTACRQRDKSCNSACQTRTNGAKV